MMMGFSLILLLLVGGLAAATIGGLLFASQRNSDAERHGARSTAHQVLDERFARGEIDREEYDTIRAQIER